MFLTHLRTQTAEALGSRVSGVHQNLLPEMGAPPCRELQLKVSDAAAEAANTEKATGWVRSVVCRGLVPVSAAQALPRQLVPADEGC